MAVQLIPAGLLAIGVFSLRESPVWLLKQGRDEDAIQVYSYYRNLPADHIYITEDVSFVKVQIEHERSVITGARPTFGAFMKSAAREACKPGMRNRFLIVFVMFMWQAWSGAAAINYCAFSSYSNCSSVRANQPQTPQQSSTRLVSQILPFGPVSTVSSKPPAQSSFSPSSLTLSAANTPGSSPHCSVQHANTILQATLPLPNHRQEVSTAPAMSKAAEQLRPPS